MADWNDPRTTRPGFGASPACGRGRTGRTTFDAGLRRHMLSIYNYMACGVLLTGVVALLFSRGGAESPAAQVFVNGGLLAWLIILSPLAIVLAMSFGAKFSTATLQAMFWGFAVLMGLSLSTVFLVYTGGSIAATFFATAGAFAGLSLFGYTTKKDLSGFGTFLIMGVVGLIIASLINMWLQSRGAELGDQLPRRADLRRPDRLRHAAAQAAVLPAARHRVRRQGDRARRAEPVPGLHQHVPVPAQLHGRLARLIAAANSLHRARGAEPRPGHFLCRAGAIGLRLIRAQGAGRQLARPRP